MKRVFSYLALFVILQLGLTSRLLAQPQPSSQTIQPSDRNDYICGFSFVVNREEEFNRNTQRLHPEYRPILSKPSGIQYSVGDTLPFYVSNFINSSREKIQAVCRAKTDSTYIFVGLTEWSTEQVSQNDVDNFLKAFEEETPPSSLDPQKGIRPILESVFGPPPNRTRDGYVYILIHDIKDSYSEGTSSSYIAGYFYPGDQGNSTYSNKKDMIYVDCNPANPSGNFVLSVVAHEFQHLIHYERDPNEETWVNEGASEYSETLCGFSLRSPSRYIRNPERSLILFDYQGSNTLLDYAKVALWTYYLGETFGHTLVGLIVKEPQNGVAGVRAALTKAGISLSFEDIFANFVVANYADNPNLKPVGYYGYKHLNFATLPKLSGIHNAYPVSLQEKNLPLYAAAYIQFNAIDSTASLSFTGQGVGDMRAQIYAPGDSEKVEQIILDENRQGNYSLQQIGKTVDQVVLIPTSLQTSNHYSYQVSTDIEDALPPQIVAGPEESLPTNTSITILWETNELSTSIVEYGLTSNYGIYLEDTTLVTDHQMVLTNLSPNTVYHYRVGSRDARGNGPTFSVDFTFRTSNIAGNTVATLRQTHAYGYQGRNLARTSDGVLHLIYHELVGNRRFVYHRSSTDSGRTWSTAVAVDTSNYYGGMPSIAADSLNRLHVAWHAQELSDSKYAIYYSQSTDGGLTWTTPKKVSQTLESFDQLYAAIAVDPQNNPHIVWNSSLYEDHYYGEVYHAWSPDGGVSWAQDQVISQSAEKLCFVPTIDFASDGTAYVFYADGDFDKQERFVYFVRSSDYANWSDPERVGYSGSLYDGLISFVIDAEDHVHVVFSDNFTPGDIRIMYARRIDGIWDAPIPIATSSTGGNVSYPNVSYAADGTIYLLFRDDMQPPSLGKVRQRLPLDENLAPLKKAVQAETGEIFLTAYRNDRWSPASNLSSSSTNSEYPEMPAEQKGHFVDLIWMEEISTSQNQLTFLHFNTELAAYDTPPQVINVYPEKEQTDVPYFKELFQIQVDFNQRIESDSLIPGNVEVQDSLGQPIPGIISYVESQRRMEFQATQNLPPESLVRVRLGANITNKSGIGLDGNGNGVAEGSPVDDFIWYFHTMPKDTLAPEFTLGVLQNPVLTRYLDLYVVASEYLPKPPELTVNNQTIPLQVNNPENNLYKGSYRLQDSGTFQLVVTGTDLAGNKGQGNKAFSAQLIIAEQGGTVPSPDHLLRLILPPLALQEDQFVTLVPGKTADEPGSGIQAVSEWVIGSYRFGPENTALSHPAELWFSAPYSSADLQIQNASGAWENVPTWIQGDERVARLSKLGKIRFVQAQETIPQHFALLQNYPNPLTRLNASTTISYTLPEKTMVTLEVYNLLGRRVATLVQSQQTAGYYRLTWNGRDRHNRMLPNGVYFLRLNVANQIFTKKMILLR